VIGMTILWGLIKQGDGYEGGEVLDPENGKIYRANVKVEDGGKTLHVRGFIGISLQGQRKSGCNDQRSRSSRNEELKGPK
jgi:uncharacterized protein (DUF2147 family)